MQRRDFGDTGISLSALSFGCMRLDGEHFTLPSGFSIDRYLGNAWHLIPEPGADEEVQDRKSVV